MCVKIVIAATDRVERQELGAVMDNNSVDVASRRGGRPAAGTDPIKRRQILEGAGKSFTALGFDATSMSDVARQADVSKATLYVYFANKERLFAAVCAERRDRNICELIALLDAEMPLEDVMMKFGQETLNRLSVPFVMAAHRIVIGVAERMPEIGQEFYASGPHRLASALAQFLDGHVKSGRLEISDTYLAAAQFLELAQATFSRPRLYCAVTTPASDAEITRVVSSALAMFLAAYGTKAQSQPV